MKAGTECEVATLARLKMHRYHSCYPCQTGEPQLVCVHHDRDDLRIALDERKGAGILVFATPVHLSNMTGLLPIFPDRTY